MRFNSVENIFRGQYDTLAYDFASEMFQSSVLLPLNETNCVDLMCFVCYKHPFGALQILYPASLIPRNLVTVNGS